MTKAFLIVSVACNVWFLFLLFYDRIMDTANKQGYFGTCITSPASGSTLRRLTLIVWVKPLSDIALRA